MIVASLLYWFGLAHVALYAIVGATALFILLINWTARHFGIGREVLMAYWRYLKERGKEAPHA